MLDDKTRIAYFIGLVSPHLDYGDIVWGDQPGLKSEMDCLQSFQNRFAKRILGKKISSSEALNSLQWVPLVGRRRRGGRRGRPPKKFFRPLSGLIWSKNKGWPRAPRPLPRIRHGLLLLVVFLLPLQYSAIYNCNTFYSSLMFFELHRVHTVFLNQLYRQFSRTSEPVSCLADLRGDG